MASSAARPWQRPLAQSGATLQYLQSERLTDISITCGTHTFKAHKIILSAASSFFDRLSDSSFKEGHSSSVSLVEDEPALVARMIFFAYTSQYPITSIADEPVSQFKTVHDDYPNAGASKLEGLARSRLHVRMYALADKYGLPALKAQSKQRFLISFYHHDETSPQIVGLPDNAASDDDGDDDDDESVDLHIMSLVYTTTPPSDRGLRDIVLEDACRQRQEEFDYRELLQAKGFRKLVAENHEIATDLALNTMTIGKSLVCDLCAVPGTWLAQRCKCGVIVNCTKEECLLDAKDTTFCIGCLECACLSPIKGD